MSQDGTRIADQAYLLNDQYQNGSNLNARIQLHARFSTNAYGWQRWVFDQFKLAPRSRILDLGCGPSHLWLENLYRIPEGWDITLSDLSAGMVQEAWRNFRDSQHRCAFEVVDAQAIPFADESFDAVIVNHVLFHVPDRTRAFSEMRRVLRPGGRFYASTIGEAHLRGLQELVSAFDPSIALGGNTVPERFGLENGLAQVSQWFSQVTLHRYEDSLVVTEADPLVAYVLSGTGNAKDVLVGEKLAAFIRFVERELVAHGAIRITKDSGMFEGLRDDSN